MSGALVLPPLDGEAEACVDGTGGFVPLSFSSSPPPLLPPVAVDGSIIYRLKEAFNFLVANHFYGNMDAECGKIYNNYMICYG